MDRTAHQELSSRQVHCNGSCIYRPDAVRSTNTRPCGLRAPYIVSTVRIHPAAEQYTRLLDYECDEELSDEELDQASERTDTLQELFAELYTSYHAHRRFATEILDVDLETWAKLHPEGATVFEVVGERINNERTIERAESHFAELLDERGEGTDSDQVTFDDEPVTLEDMTDVRYETLVTVWKDTLVEIPT